MDEDAVTYSRYGDELPYTSTNRSARSTGSFFPGNASFGSYHSYPYGKDHTVKEEVNTFPENNSKAVMTALKSLQEKIRKLELDRSQAKVNLDKLSSEAKEYQKKFTTNKESDPGPDMNQNVSPVDANAHLATTEAKCNLLEKQLEYMRKMVQSAEQDRNDAIHRSNALAQQAAKQASEHIQNKLEKISGLERHHIQLNAAQTVAENKIRELEEKLVEERHKRKLIEDKTAELATTAETNRILMEVTSPKRNVKKKKVKKTRRPPSPPPSQPQSHYRLNMGNIPFIVGTSTAKSFNVGANIQGALSLLKTHHPALCNTATKNRKKFCRTRSLVSDTDTAADIDEVLLALQDEFGNMGFEHKELLKQIQDTEEERLREDLERELDQLVARMENKGEQIAMLKQHKERLRRATKRKKKRPTSAATSTTATQQHATKCLSVRGGEVEVVTTVKTKPNRANLEPTKSQVAKQNLDVLRGMNKLQTSLRKDDLSWD